MSTSKFTSRADYIIRNWPRYQNFEGAPDRSRGACERIAETDFEDELARQREARVQAIRDAKKIVACAEIGSSSVRRPSEALRVLAEDGGWVPARGLYQTAVGFIDPERIPGMLRDLLESTSVPVPLGPGVVSIRLDTLRRLLALAEVGDTALADQIEER